MEKINEIKIPEGVESISVTQHDDKIVIEFIPKKPKFKEGDFVYEDGRIMIVKNYPDNYPNSYYALIYPELDMEPVYNRRYAPNRSLSCLSFRYAAEEEKQLLIDALKKDGKRWNAEKLEIENIPEHRFKVGDKVQIKDGISSKTHWDAHPNFIESMDEFIGKELTVEGYRNGFVILNEDGYEYYFSEGWLEPWSDEPKKGDLAIFWDYNKALALIRIYDKKGNEYHYDSHGAWWDNSIKFESKEQFEKVLRGEI